MNVRLRASVRFALAAAVAQSSWLPPPRDRSAAMQRRAQHGDELLRWAEGPRQLRAQLLRASAPRPAPGPGGAVRVLVQ